MSMIALFRPGGLGGGAPRALALAALAAAAFAQGGCSSFGGGCGPCGEGFGSRLRNCSILNGTAFRQRFFNHGSSACEPGCVGESCGGGMPMGGSVMPIPGPGPVIGTPVEDPLELSPAGIPAGPPTTTSPPAGPTSSAPKTGAQASNRAYRPRTGQALARRSTTPRAITPEPAPGPAAGVVASTGPGLSVKVAPDDFFAKNLPPVKASAPADATPPPAKEAESISESAPVAAEVKATPVAPASSPDTPAPPKGDEAGFSAGPGIRPFWSVSPELAGGGEPTPKGWEWLAKDGAYKTALDLRDVTEDRQAANAAASANGLRYVSLPVSPEKLNATVVKQFLEETSVASARPLYFFDTDGRRAAALWYIKLVSVDKLSSQEALKRAKEIGTPDFDLLIASNRYISSLNPPPPPTAEPAPTKAPETTAKPAESAPIFDPNAAAPSAATSASKSDEPAIESVTWKPYAALLMAGLGVPLAFLGRSAFLDHQHRASLPAPARATRSLPPSSDA